MFPNFPNNEMMTEIFIELDKHIIVTKMVE